MMPRVLDLLRGRDAAVALPVAASPSTAPDAGSDATQTRMVAIRETIDLIETDLAAMIRDVLRASDAVRAGTRDSAEILGAIRGQSESLATMTTQATENAAHLAVATEEFAQSSGEIGR